MKTSQPGNKTSTEDRFWSSVIGSDVEHCWLWNGARTHGYGAFNENRKAVRAHRWAWMHLRGDIPKGLVLDHLCRVTMCVNPWHLEPVSQAENVRRGKLGQYARRVVCVQGHEMTSENTIIATPRGRAVRICRTCRNAWQKAHRPSRALSSEARQAVSA